MSEDSLLNDSMFLREFVKHESALRAYARALLPDWNAVDEAIQEASVVMWRKIDQLKSENDFLPWAKTVLRFEALKVRRKFARDRHVFNDELIEELTALLERLAGEDRIRALVLTGEGKSFSAGADLNWMSSMVEYSMEENKKDSQALAEMFDAINEQLKLDSLKSF